MVVVAVLVVDFIEVVVVAVLVDLVEGVREKERERGRE